MVSHHFLGEGDLSREEEGSTNHNQGEGVGGAADYVNEYAKWVHFYCWSVIETALSDGMCFLTEP